MSWWEEEIDVGQELKNNCTKVCTFVQNRYLWFMKRYFLFANAVVRPLMCKNCYNWVLACEFDGVVYYYSQMRITKTTIGNVLGIHNQVTYQKPVKIKKAESWQLSGAGFNMIGWAIENKAENMYIPEELYQEIMTKIYGYKKSANA